MFTNNSVYSNAYVWTAQCYVRKLTGCGKLVNVPDEKIEAE